jgi:hypothetical protein
MIPIRRQAPVHAQEMQLNHNLEGSRINNEQPPRPTNLKQPHIGHDEPFRPHEILYKVLTPDFHYYLYGHPYSLMIVIVLVILSLVLALKTFNYRKAPDSSPLWTKTYCRHNEKRPKLLPRDSWHSKTTLVS